MALNDILKNGKYPDDMILNLPDGTTVNVGEIRALPVAERQALTAQITERQNILGQAELAFASKFQEAVKAGWLANDGKIIPPTAPARAADPAPTAASIRAAAATEFDLDENDPLLGPVVKLVKQELDKRDQTITDLRTKLDALPGQFDSLKSTLTDSLGKVTGVVNTSVGRYLNDTYQSDFAQATRDLPTGVKVDYEAAYKYASDHKLQDKDGFLQIADAVDRLTWNDRKKAELEAERAALVTKTTKELEEKQRVSALTPPSRNPLQNQAQPKEGEFKPYNERTDSKGNKVRSVKSFEEAMSEAMSDEDVSGQPSRQPVLEWCSSNCEVDRRGEAVNSKEKSMTPSQLAIKRLSELRRELRKEFPMPYTEDSEQAAVFSQISIYIHNFDVFLHADWPIPIGDQKEAWKKAEQAYLASAA
jgi:hypothetical protein